MSEHTKNAGRVYPEVHKSPPGRYPTYGLRKQTVRTLDEVIARNRKELGYGD